VRPSYRQSRKAYHQLQGMEDSATACFRDNQGNSYQELDDHTLMGFIGDINQLQRQHHTAEEELNDTLDSLMEAIDPDRPLCQQPS
ncbi:MAG: hypothetical protein SVU32_04130, partial [Candidatus Nanohaloarchaea archaeon]|nr:hypothetical protein [Candidatus Nanohaloarchaea archaeon]